MRPGRRGARSWSPWCLASAAPSLIQFGISTLLLATLAQSWNIIGGYTGYASFGNSVFYGLGSYGMAIAMVQWHLPFGVGLALGAVLAVLFALLLGLPVLRLRGHYFAICTLGTRRGDDGDRFQPRDRRHATSASSCRCSAATRCSTSWRSACSR